MSEDIDNINSKPKEPLNRFLIEDAKGFDNKKRSEVNLNALIETFKEDYSNIVSFVGAGISKPLGIKGWYALLKYLLDNCDNKFKEENLSRLKEPGNYIELANDIENNIGFTELMELIEIQMSDYTTTTNATLVKMILAINIHITTNFDRSIEHAYTFLKFLYSISNSNKFKKKIDLYYVHNLNESKINITHDSIYYIHADLNNKVFVFTEDLYKKYYESSTKIGKCLSNHFENSTIIFLGFSFDDDYVKSKIFEISVELKEDEKIIQETSKKISNPIKTKETKHFLIISKHNAGNTPEKINSFYDTYEDYNIYPIILEDDKFIFLEKLFEEFCTIKYNQTKILYG